MKAPFYITTAIAYSSAVPHFGNVYEIILADAIARFKRLDGYDVWFQTGTDEHGQKIESNAKKNEISPQAYVDQISKTIQATYDKVGTSYNHFIRTTDEYHQKIVQDVYQKLYDQGDIYLGKYEGWYSVSEEAYILEKDIVDGKGPNGDIPIWTTEEVFFLKLSKYQDRLIEHIKQNPEFILPESRRNEMLQSFLSEPLPDLSVSRTSFKWGIPLDHLKKGHVSYVWIDALSNYITGLNYNPNANLSTMMKKFWPAQIHLIGKDVLRFHTIYWPIMLMALGLELPKTVFGHPWVLFNKGKMSKSTGNVIYTDQLIKHFGTDTVRYYALHEIPFASDGNLTYELIIERNNTDLANTLGNLVNRSLGMVKKYRNSFLKKTTLKVSTDINLEEECLNLLDKVRRYMDQYRVSDALEEVIKLARNANKFIDLTEPWKLAKDENAQEKLDAVLYHLIATIRFIASLLQPFMPETALKINEAIGHCDLSFSSLSEFFMIEDTKLLESKVLFERYDLNLKIEEILND